MKKLFWISAVSTVASNWFIQTYFWILAGFTVGILISWGIKKFIVRK